MSTDNVEVNIKKTLPKFVTSVKKRKALSLELKNNIIKDYEDGMKNPQIARKYNLSQSTTLSIIKDKAKILDDIRNSSSLKLCKVRKRYGILAKMEDLMVVWCENQTNSANGILHASAVCEHAQSIFNELKKEVSDNSKNKQFVASYEWLCQFRKRYSLDNIVDNIISDKTKSEPVDIGEYSSYETQMINISQEPECIVQEIEEFDNNIDQANSSNLVIRRKSLSFELKMNIINDFENGMKRSKISRKYKLAKSTVLTIIKERFKILEAVKNVQSLKSCKVQKRYGIIEKMEQMLKAWCEHEILTTKGTLERSLVFEQANIIFDKLNKEADCQNYKFVANEYWFKRFKKRWATGKIINTSDSEEVLGINDLSRVPIESNGILNSEINCNSINCSTTSISSDDETEMNSENDENIYNDDSSPAATQSKCSNRELLQRLACQQNGTKKLELNDDLNEINSTESCSSSLIKKRKALSVELKQNIINDYEKGMNRNKLSHRYKLASSTILTIIKNKAKILSASQNLKTSNTFKIRKRNSIIYKMETLLKTWCEEQINMGYPINQKVICRQAKMFFNELKEEAGEEHKNDKFEASNGWYNLFKKRNSSNAIECKVLENTSTTADLLTGSTKEYSIDDIVNQFNINETQFNKSSLNNIPLSESNNQTNLWIDKTQQQHAESELNAMMKLSQGLEYIERGIRMFEEVDLDVNRAATVRHDIERAITCYCKILDSLSNRNTYHFMETSSAQK